ncbi:biliverdin-producing heme oxygenase [Azohydromonas caseinilytica]|uniref:Biliverdin-producing heme oxygenase n=1 Tax=Azohydromonas caseinilytica TaxID=2728836 RepID=A0A848F9W9_9BURK|nr:biliverdin-producing heme oxygenase [Azohydromonas caseinilytica]NML15646.1 biliverdin-producing heme oxygenase [Azohydromonas caseinilytica]
MNEEAQTVLGALRAATAAQHGAIERLLRLEPATLERGHYVRVLAGFGAFVPCWEARVRERLPARLLGWFDERSRWPHLRRDLGTLGLAASADAPDAACAPALPDLPAVFGSMYVLEGSALGGQLIARALRERWALGPDNGAAYFNGWGARTGALWADFRRRLAQEVEAGGAAQRSACAAAVATFEALNRTFERVLADGRVAA